MSNWPLSPRIDPDDELKVADALLDKADALLRRRHKAPDLPEPDTFVALEDEDLPVLTEVVDPSDLPDALRAAAAARRGPEVAPAGMRAAPSQQLAERLVGLDTEISREVEAWFATEFPQLLARELDRLSERLQEETLAHLRATLLPSLSERISQRLEPGPATRR